LAGVARLGNRWSILKGEDLPAGAVEWLDFVAPQGMRPVPMGSRPELQLMAQAFTECQANESEMPNINTELDTVHERCADNERDSRQRILF
jgi:hypothetical protein